MRVEVIGPLRVAGARTGDVVDLDPAAVNVAALVEGGHVKVLPEPKKRADR